MTAADKEFLKELHKKPDKAVENNTLKILAFGILIFLAKDYFLEGKSESKSMTILISKVERLSLDVRDLEMKTGKRYTTDDATKRETIVDKTIAKIEANIENIEENILPLLRQRITIMEQNSK